VVEEAESKEFKSKLSTGRTRFLANAVQHSLSSGRRAAADFIRCFPPSRIMEALGAKPELRARILVETTGTRERVALQKSAASAGEDLQIALDVAETDPEAIVRLFRPDDRVRYLDAKELWAFVCEGEFWKAQLDGMALEISRSHIGYVINNAMEEKLLKARDVIDGVGVDRLAEVLPRTELGWMLAKALERGRGRKPFTDEQFLAEAPIGVLSDHVPLAELWDRVVTAHVAVPQSFLEALTRESAVPEPLVADETRASGVPPASEEAEAAAKAAANATGDTTRDTGMKATTKAAMKTTTQGVGVVSAPADDSSTEGNNFDFSDVTASEGIEEAVAKVTSS